MSQNVCQWCGGYHASVRDCPKVYPAPPATERAEAKDARDEAVERVDGRLGYTIEFANDKHAHKAAYDEEEERILAERAVAPSPALPERPRMTDAAKGLNWTQRPDGLWNAECECGSTLCGWEEHRRRLAESVHRNTSESHLKWRAEKAEAELSAAREREARLESELSLARVESASMKKGGLWWKERHDERMAEVAALKKELEAGAVWEQAHQEEALRARKDAAELRGTLERIQFLAKDRTLWGTIPAIVDAALAPSGTGEKA